MEKNPYQQPVKIVNPKIESYLFSLLDERTKDPVLSEMEVLAEKRRFPIIGRVVGNLVYQLAKLVVARRVFEFGSGFGYSAYWFAKALPKGGTVICSDGSRDNLELAEGFLKRAGLWDKVEYHVGWAQEIFQQVDGEFDICYNDVDKGDYPEVWRLARERVRVGGLYIADNCLWYGRVAESGPVDDVVPGWTEAIREHNRMIFDDPDFEPFICPVRDGVLVARRIR